MFLFADASAKISSNDLIFTGSLAEDLPPAHAEVAGSPLDGGGGGEGVRGGESEGEFKLSRVVSPQGGGWPGEGPIFRWYFF